MGQPLRVLDEPEKSLAPALFSDTFDASPEGLALDSPCRILHANPAFAGLFGYSNPAEQEAGGKLREQEYSAVIIDQFLLEAEPDGSEQML